ncbi:MAG: DUF456 family protein [Chloroflexi bacterium]|nr:DUF456 family protein [Chloroflexota bacterium]
MIGSIVGAIVGAIAGLWTMEYRAKGDRDAATRSVHSYIGGVLLEMAIEMGAAVVVIVIFAWQAFV